MFYVVVMRILRHNYRLKISALHYGFSKGVLLPLKRSPFGVQKDYIFQSAKIPLVFSHNYITKIQKNVRFRSFNEHFARAE
mgnify:CR=1 FL=1